MAKEENLGFRDQKYGEWHRSLVHNHLMLDFDMFDLSDRTLFGIFAGLDEDKDDDCKFVFECKEIRLNDGVYKMPYMDPNQYKCLRSFCKRYNKQGERNDIPVYVVAYSIDKEKNERWFVVHAVNDSALLKLNEYSKRRSRSIVMSENDYIGFLSNIIKRKFKCGSTWLPKKELIDKSQFKNTVV
jgi:hypothetical protein